MSLEGNKKTATTLVEDLAKGQIDSTFFTDDAVWWVPGADAFPLAAFEKGFAGFASMIGDGARMIIHGVTAEGDRVAVEAESIFPLKNGKTYNNTYHFMIGLRDGKVFSVREYNNTAYVRDLFGG
jgi:ketosteroid isomerase-like protein